MYTGAKIDDQIKVITSPRNGRAMNAVLNGAISHIPVKKKNDSSPITISGGVSLKNRII
jgi:hypothetical protein